MAKPLNVPVCERLQNWNVRGGYLNFWSWRLEQRLPAISGLTISGASGSELRQQKLI
jgi:hypothetical protein